MKSIFNLLYPHRMLSIILLIVTMLAAGFEAIGIAMILPLVTLISNKENLEIFTNDWVNNFFNNFLNNFGKFIGSENQLMSVVLLIFMLFLLKNLMIYLRSVLTVYFRDTIRADISIRLLKKYTDMSISELALNDPGKLINNLTEESRLIGKFYVTCISFLSKIFLIIAVYFFLITINYKIVFYLTIFIIFFLISFRLLSKITIHDSGSKRLKYTQDITNQSQQAIFAMRDIKLLNLKTITIDNFSLVFSKLKKTLLKLSIFQSMPAPLIEVLSLFVFTCFIFYVETFTEKNILEFIPTLALFAVAFQRIGSNFSSAISESVFFSAYMPSIHLANSLLVNEDNIENNNKTIDKIESNRIVQELSIKDLSYSYTKDRKILKNISLNIKKNSITAFVGKSGSGKSTLLDLICAFYNPDTGEIRDGFNNINLYSKDHWREKISVVSSNSFFFPGTIRQNIILSNKNASLKKIDLALDISQSKKFINELKNGLDTLVGIDGNKLSSGQYQRLAIARSLIKDSSLIIFDEATSNIDNQNEKAFIEKLPKLKDDKTIIIVTHNLKNLKIADYIYFFEDGEILGEGKFDDVSELINKL